MKYLKKFETVLQYEAYITSEDKVLPNVSLCDDINGIYFNPYIPPHDYTSDYLTIESLEDNNTISWKESDSGFLAKTISVSTDNGSTWTDKTSNTTGVTLATLNTGDKLLIKGNNSTYANSEYYNYFVSTGEFNVSGNIMSLLHGDNFNGQTTLSAYGYNIFSYLFSNCTKLKNAEHLSLPATTLAQSCYYAMFSGCTNLTTAPELPATTLASGCYQLMFYNCTSLTTAPELPVTTLAQSCYYGMFKGCTSLTIAPELLATSLANSCYQQMFVGCTSLTTAPELPATTLVEYCYCNMFSRCTSLSSITCLATNISASSCTSDWVQNVAASGTFTKAASMSSWTTGNNGIPNGWTVQDYTE